VRAIQRREGAFHAVAAVVFGLVHGVIGYFQQLRQLVAMALALGHPGGKGDVQLVAVDAQGLCGQALANGVYQGVGFVQAVAWQGNGKLFAPHTAKLCFGRQCGGNELRHALQDYVTAGMAVVIVDGFEVVDIQHGYAIGLVVQPRQLQGLAGS